MGMRAGWKRWFGRKAAIWPYATCPMACSTPPERAARYPLCRGLWSGFCRDASARSSAAAPAAFAFNLNTLRRSQVVQHMQEAGLEVVSRPPYNDFSHWVEQAVDRDVVIGRKA